ncbi:TetR/AcrR family transcriptional regulator [Salinigranum salinum]|uniref:TetR/AcrR family transcriptional regulator n=1 Tax=Salinigranum salinum TaxID=1364937 RepID=UPI001260C890|nr:TetR/AcrR family transcriptional regulator [Salinigranum salinum]
MSDRPSPSARTEVVRAVKSALARHGYAGLTTKKVAAESDKSEAFFFYHYDTKDDLVVAFLDWAIERNETRLADLDDDPVDRLYDTLDFLVGDPTDEVDRGINVAMMELLSHAPHNDRFSERLTAYEQSVLDLFVEILEEGIEREVFRAVDPADVAAYLLVTANGTAGAAMALRMDHVDGGVRRELDRYLRTCVLRDDVAPPSDVLVR